MSAAHNDSLSKEMETMAVENIGVAIKDSSWDPDFFKRVEDDKLAKMGYKQQMERNWNLIQSCGISLSAMSVGSGLLATFSYGIATGGPETMVICWIIVSFFSLFIVLTLAEIVSTTPLSGGPYSWSAAIAPATCTAFVPWITGWLSLLGVSSATAAISFAVAQLIQTTIAAKTDYTPTAEKTIGIVAGVLCSWAIVNAHARGMLRYLLGAAILLNTVGVIALSIALLTKAAPRLQPASFVFKKFIDRTGVDGADGWSIRTSPALVGCLGCGPSQIVLLGYDSSAHVSEETERASWSVSVGMVLSAACGAITGAILLLALLFSIRDLEEVLNTPSTGTPFKIIVEVFGLNTTTVLFCFIIILCWLCGLITMTCNSRLIFALGRDRGLPHVLSKINEKSLCPVRAIWGNAFFSFFLVLPSLGSTVAFTAVISIEGIGILLSYAIPIMTRIIYHENFKSLKGPFSLGSWSRPIAVVSLGWITYMVIILCLPLQTPVTGSNFNYAPVAVAAVTLWATLTWPIAKKWFSGPAKGRMFLSDHGDLRRDRAP